MNCSDASNALVEKSFGTPLPPEAEEHLNGCKRCQEFARMLNEPVPVSPPSPAILGQIEQRIAQDLRPVRPIAAPRYFLAAIFSILVSIVAFAVYSVGAVRVMSALQSVVILAVLAMAASLLAYSLVHQMAPGDRHRIPPAPVAIGVVILLALTMVILFRFQPEAHYWLNCWTCIRRGLPVGAIASIAIWLVLRRGAILAPALTGAATGLLAGLAGTSMLELHCPDLHAGHILMSHLGVAVLCAMAGWAIGLTAEISSSRG